MSVDNKPLNIDDIIEIIKSNPEQVQIINAQIDVDLQYEYFEKSTSFRDVDIKINLSDSKAIIENTDSNVDDIKHEFVKLALSGDIEAFRYLESFVKNVESKYKSWALLSYQEAKMIIESELLEESRIFISSGLGGKEHKLRFVIFFSKKDKQTFSDFEKQTILSECNYYFTKNNIESEKIEFIENYVQILCLLPIEDNMKNLFTDILKEINNYGDFLNKEYYITNDKIPNIQDLEELDSKTEDLF